MTDDSGTPLEIRIELRKKLAQHFNKEELRTLCFDLGIQYENLPDTLEGMARDLVAFLDRRGRIPDLIAKCRTLRPKVTWEDTDPKSNKEEVDKLLNQAHTLYGQRLYDQAIALLEKARSAYPKNQEIERLYIEVVYSQGVGWHEAGNLPGAESVFAEVLELAPQYKDAAQRLDEVRQQLLLQRAQTLYDAKDYDRAIALLEKAHLDYPKNQEIERLYIEVVYFQGVSWHEAGNLPKAESAFAEVLELAPRYKDAAKLLDRVRQQLLLQQAQVHYNRKDYVPAIALLEKAHLDYPKNQEIERLHIEVVCQQAQALYNEQYYDQAIALLKKAHSDYPKNQMIKRQLRRDTLLRFLRDPMWQGIGAVVAILALALTVCGPLFIGPNPPPTVTAPPAPSQPLAPTIPPTTAITPTLSLSPSPTPAVTSSAAVALQAWHDEYVAVTDRTTTTQRLKAIATQVDESSRFTLLCLTNDKVALQFFKRFVSALNNEGKRNWELRAGAPERLAWEEFTLVDPDTRDPLHCVEVLKQLQQGEVRLAFQTSHGKFVTAFGQDQDWVLRAETTALDRYEKFAAINLALTPTVTLTPTLSPTPTPTCPTHQDYHCQEKGALVTATPGPSDEYCTETVALPEPTLAHTISIFMTKRKLEDLGYSLYEVEAYGPDNPQKNLLAPYLFSIEAGPTVLVEGAVSSYLREQFRRKSTVLSPEARLRFDPTGKRWAIVDNDRIYAIDSENGKLDVSGGAQAHASGGAQALVSKEDDGRIAPYAIDGSLVTRWASAKCCKFGGCLDDDYGNMKCDNLEGQDPQLLEITLPQQTLVDRIVLKWEKAYALEYCVTVKPAP